MHPEFWINTSEFHKLRADFIYKVCPIKTPERLINKDIKKCTNFQ